MLIVCPSCATSYMVDPGSLGQAGRAVRCARCKTTWFAGGPKNAPAVTTFVHRVIAEAEAESAETSSGSSPRQPDKAAPAPEQAPAANDFSGEPPKHLAEPSADHSAEHSTQHLSDSVGEPPPAEPEPEPAPLAEQAPHHTDLVPRDDVAQEPVALTDAPSLVPPIEQAPLPDAAPSEHETEHEAEDIESFAARRARLKARRNQKRRSSRWTAIILVLFAFNVALVGARSEIVRYLPQTASLFAAIGLPVNLRHLKFENVAISKEAQDGVEILIVRGSIVSTAGKAAEVPRLRFAARNASGQEVYVWTALPTRSILGPGESLEFSSRLAAPPADASDVMVRFFNSQDAIAGAK